MEMQFKNEIKKLADVVVWADNWIEEMKIDLTEEEFAEDEEVKEFEMVRSVVLDAMNRHTTYTNALNKDIADRDAKIERLEKEIEGRKETYTALKELMDTKYISIEEHNSVITDASRFSDCWQNKYLSAKKELDNCKEEIRKLNKSIMNKNEMMNTVNGVNANLRKEIGAHEEENARLSEKIIELKRKIEKCKDYDTSLIDSLRINNDDLKEENTYLKKECKNKNDIIKKAYDRYVNEACKSREEIMNECYEKLTKDDTGYTGFKQYTLRALEAQEGDEKKTKEFLCNTAEIIFRNKRTEKKREEETEVKDVKGPIIFDEYHKYNWFPCGEDAIE